jgi:large subunit ribosomal protein L11
VGTISQQALREIAETKIVDLNASSTEEAMSIIAGTARSMGIQISEE